MKITAIALAGRNWEIGRDNGLIWVIPEDMRLFRSITEGHPIVMGRKTFQSLPGLLPNRKHYVLTSNTESFYSEGAYPHEALEDVVQECVRAGHSSLFVIGGGQLYKEVIDRGIAHQVILTRVDDELANADTFFPNMDTQSFYTEIASERLTDNSRVHTYLRNDIL